jgi:hypothetical protein
MAERLCCMNNLISPIHATKPTCIEKFLRVLEQQ